METPIGSRQAAMLFSDMIMLQAGCGRSEDALRSLEEVTSFAWSDGVYRPFGDKRSFVDEMRAVLAGPERIGTTVDANIEVMGLRKIPCEELAI